jgi:cell division protein FtsL
MNIQRSHIFGFVGLVGFAFALYWAKAEAQGAREQVVALQTQVDKQRRDVRTLEAEVAWMERPDRLEATARQKMGLVPISAANTASLNDLDEVAPLAQPQLPQTPVLSPTPTVQPTETSVP